MWDTHAGMGWWMMFASFWFVVVLALAFGVMMFTRSASVPREGLRGGALDIAEKRYARGELTREQYEQLRRDLTMEWRGAEPQPPAVPGDTENRDDSRLQ